MTSIIGVENILAITVNGVHRLALQSRRSRVLFQMVSLEIFIDIILPAADHGPGFDSTSNRDEYLEFLLGGKGGRCAGLKTLPQSCADFLEICEHQPLETLGTCPSLLMDCLTTLQE